MESIEKLRGYTIFDRTGDLTAKLVSDFVADEIEREISERYMPLPVDADGVPWTKEDKMFAYFKDPYDAYEIVEYVYNVNDESWYIRGLSEGCTSEYYALHCVHVKSDPIKELLEEFLGVCKNAKTELISVQGVEAVEIAAINEYADKLREVLGGDVDA